VIELETDVLPQLFVVFFDRFQPGHGELCVFLAAIRLTGWQSKPRLCEDYDLLFFVGLFQIVK
jgi:hypothetical protein